MVFILDKYYSLNMVKKIYINLWIEKFTKNVELIIWYILGTYVLFSWDIMEPITCMLGVLDLIIGYVYWMSSNKDYSF